MSGIETIASGPMWAGFVGFVLLMLALDLFVFGGNKAHKVGVKEAGLWSLAWVSMALLFNGGLWWYLKTTAGADVADQKALEFLSGYLIGDKLMNGKAAALDVQLDNGHVILFGFRPEWRGQPFGSFKVLFNAILGSTPPSAR